VVKRDGIAEYTRTSRNTGFRQLHILIPPLRQAMEMTEYGKHGKPIKPAFHASHTLWKSLQDSHITTASTTG
jgi:hypothetical protein